MFISPDVVCCGGSCSHVVALYVVLSWWDGVPLQTKYIADAITMELSLDVYSLFIYFVIVTGYGKTNHSPHFVETEINTPSESTFIADHNGTFIFSIRLSCAKLQAFECEQHAS